MIAMHVDDLLVWSRDEMKIINDIKEEFQLKNVGPPDCCLGANVDCLSEHWLKENIGLGFSAKSYIDNVVPKFEDCFNMKFKSHKTPTTVDFHPEIDETPFLSD